MLITTLNCATETGEIKMKTLKILVYINIVLVALCLVGSVYGFIAISDANYRTSIAMEFVILLSSVMYLVKGYKKDAAKYYQAFMLLNAFSFIVEFVPSAVQYLTTGVNTVSGLGAIESLIVYGNFLLLGLSKDLGKKVSYNLCGINSLAYAIVLIVGCINLGQHSTAATLPLIVLYATWFITSGIAGVMTVAKYEDKKIRKSQG